jgi:hypothetical protein
MKKSVSLAVLALILYGCDYEIPLVVEPSENIDPALCGVWRQSNPGGEEHKLLILPISAREVLAVYPVNTKNAMFGKGVIWSPDELDLFQINWFGKADGSLPSNRRTYQYAAWSLNGDVLNIHLINPKLVDPATSSAAGLAEKIIANIADPELFRDALIFKRIRR